ncbi:MAG: TetR/AcrR family transcriptional regulator [Actinomycetota bacterium]
MNLTIRKRVTKSPDVRRKELMDAAVRVFTDKGISKTTVSDITDTAGVAKGTFYLYFDSKDQLLGALKERLIDEILAHATQQYQRVGQEDWWALVDSVIESFVDFMLERRDMVHVLMQEGLSPETDQIFRECEERVDAMFASGIQAGIEAGAFHSTDPEIMARFFHHAIDGYLIHEVLYGEDIDRERFLKGAKELVRKALAP